MNTARFYTDPVAEQEEQARKKKQAEAFKELLAVVYGCRTGDCSYRLPGWTLDRSDTWFERFEKAEGCNTPSGPQSCLVACTPVASNLQIRRNEVAAHIPQDKSPRDCLMTALAMATCAKAHKSMRKDGAKIEGKTPQEKVYLMMAAEYVGLKVRNPDPALKRQMAQFKAQIGADAIWQEYSAIMAGHIIPPAPETPQAEPPANQNEQQAEAPETPEQPEQAEAPAPEKPEEKAEEKPAEKPPEKPAEKPESLTQIFNREIAAEAKPFLQASKLDEKTYLAVSEAIIRDQDARGDTVKERYKDRFNLTVNQIQNILKAMDAEGLTSSRPGKARAVNYDRLGRPKDNSPNVS